MSRAWIAVASAEHVRRGLAGGFMQVCHGKDGPLRRMRPGDRVAYYSPTETFGGTDRDAAYLDRLQEQARARRAGLWGACPAA